MKETLEEDLKFPIIIENGLDYLNLTTKIFNNGAKWQQERSYSDMQEYATFCIECYRKEMPLLLVEDWYEHYKK